MYVCTHALVGSGVRKRLGPLELDLEVIVKGLAWVLETELLSSRRAENTFNYWAISPGPIFEAGSHVAQAGLQLAL